MFNIWKLKVLNTSNLVFICELKIYRQKKKNIYIYIDRTNPISLPEILKLWSGASLVAQWLRIRLPVQETQVRALVWEDPTCHGATKPVRHNYWACEPQLLSLRATTTEAHMPRAHALQQEKPPQWEACTPRWRVAPSRYT